MSKNTRLIAKSSVVALLALGCHRTAEPAQPAPELPPAGPDGTYEASMPDTSEAYQARRIELDVGAPFDNCGLTEVHFFYDVSKARPQAHPRLEALADCLNTPPQNQVDVVLVGRADPRGPAAYNEALGGERAEYVKQRLIDYGVEANRLQAKSAGESAAKGAKDPDYSYGYDRRVDVVQVRAVAPQ